MQHLVKKGEDFYDRAFDMSCEKIESEGDRFKREIWDNRTCKGDVKQIERMRETHAKAIKLRLHNIIWPRVAYRHIFEYFVVPFSCEKIEVELKKAKEKIYEKRRCKDDKLMHRGVEAWAKLHEMGHWRDA